jgi:hypothetical protein
MERLGAAADLLLWLAGHLPGDRVTGDLVRLVTGQDVFLDFCACDHLAR